MQAALNVLGWIGVAIVFGAVVVRFTKPEWDQYAVYGAWGGLALVLLYTAGQWREIVDYFKRRNARYAAMAGVSVLVVLGLLVAVNYLSARRNKRWDLTANQQNSLSEQSVKLLQGLTSPVKFLVFDRSDGFDRFRPRLTEYSYQSKQVSVDYVDVDRRPLEAREYEVEAYGTVVIDYMGRRERVTSESEQDLTNALIKILDPQTKKVYFLSGHGEKDPAGTDRTGLSTVADAMRRDNYEFDTLVLAQTNEIPADATALVISGPKSDLLDTETTLIESYLAKGGKLMVLFDPPDDLKSPAKYPQLDALLASWGIKAIDSVVVDLSTTNRTIAVAAGYPSHPITDSFQLLTLFPLARAIVPSTDTPNRTPQSFVQTAARSWAETTLTQLETPESLAPEPEKGDITGPVSLAVAVSAPVADAPTPPAPPADGEAPQTPESRVVVFGDSDFASNAYVGAQGNRDLFMNAVNWVSQQENLIAIRPRDPADRRITLTDNVSSALFWLSLVLIPGAIFVAGTYTWWRRR